MKQRTRTLIVALSLFSMCGISTPVLADPLPLEPADQFLVTEEVDYVVGLYFREYSIAANGVVDYRTARQILLTELNEAQAMTIEAEEFPLFYWYDKDQDGQFEMWIDRNVQGCTCDIVRYSASASLR